MCIRDRVSGPVLMGPDHPYGAVTTEVGSSVLGTAPEATPVPDDTLVITVPPETEPSITEPTDTEPTDTEPSDTEPTETDASSPDTTAGGVAGAVRVTDDLNFFSVLVPDDLEVDSSPVVSQDDFTLPAVTAADDVDAYNTDDTTFGLSVIGVGPEVGSDVDEVLAFLEPNEGVCTGRELNIGYPTALGATTMLKLDGCGPDGSGVKVIIVIEFPARDAVVGVYAQSTDTTATLLPIAQTVLESILPV